jgi:hypothetical protein
MKTFIFALLTLFLITSCQKEKIQPTDPCHFGTIINMHTEVIPTWPIEGEPYDKVYYIFTLKNDCSGQEMTANVSRKDYYDYDINDKYKIGYSW